MRGWRFISWAPGANAGQGDVKLTGWTGSLSGLAPAAGLSSAMQGIAVFQERASAAPLTLSGQGNVLITGSLYAAGATVQVTGGGSLSLHGDAVRGIGAHLLASDLRVTGNGGVFVDVSNNDLGVW
jgi:hypothetical protein